MCGIAGKIGSHGTIDPSMLHKFVDALRHRGPDDWGIFLNESRTVGLAQTRLSILDLSSAGHQPMTTLDGRYTIVFNGEIYNFRKLRPDLQRRGVNFESDSDTEVLLYLYAEHGPSMLPMLAGMFALAIWDAQEQSAFLARDPLGIKPMYYGLADGCLVFASEMRALLSNWSLPRRLDVHSLGEFLLFGNVPDPGTLVQGVHSLPAGHAITWKSGAISTRQYWEPSYIPNRVASDVAVSITRSALEESMGRHLVSDVPVGVFLSGGIDSTALVALASASPSTNQPLKTFCISFDESDFNEGALADRTAKHFGTEHYDWRLNTEEGLSLVDSFLDALDRPTNDGFNTFCVSQFARNHGLKVVLSGLGGDELFGSYPSFRMIPKLLRWRLLAERSGPLAGFFGSMLATSSKANICRLGAFLQCPPSKLAAYWAVRGFFTPREVETLVAHYSGQASVDATSLLAEPVAEQPTDQDMVAYLESTRYMQFQLLRDSDVFSMAQGLELRVPFVDSRLFDTINAIPRSIRLARGKKLLCDAVPEIPAWIANAPKRGFRFPFERWARTHWANRFEELDKSVPVKLHNWYRKWTLLILEHFMQFNHVS